jgi:uncharacterized membrane protein YcjF (UPF0283 family)
MGFDPYSAAAQLAAKVAFVLLLIGVLVYGWLRIDSLVLQRDAAVGEAKQYAAELEVQAANAAFNAKLAKQAAERATARRKAVESVRGGIAHVDVPEACKAVLAPIASARAGLFSLQAAEIRLATTPRP